jgi:hypothetical protein
LFINHRAASGSILSRLQGSDGAILAQADKAVNVELVVQCVRETENPQTHHHALMLLAEVAKLFPEYVRHTRPAFIQSCMKLFKPFKPCD